MAVLKDKYEISVWGDKVFERINSNSSKQLSYYNEKNGEVSLPVEIELEEQKNNNAFKLPSQINNCTVTLTNSIQTTSFTLNFENAFSNTFLFGRGTYNTSTQILTKTHNYLSITKEDMVETTRTASSGYAWYSYSGIKNLVDLTKRNGDNCSFNLGTYNNSSGAANAHFYIDSTGVLYSHLLKNSDSGLCEYVYPTLNQEIRSINLSNPVSFLSGETTVVAVDTSTNFKFNLYIPSHFREYKICNIGTDELASEFRAIEPKFVENINGTHTLTFYMYYNINGEENPYIKYLFNERKIKVNWKDEWYDLVIKNLIKDSNNRTVTYTCKDAYENELSKSGYDLIFDDELQNNTGTPEELAQRVLEGTDWLVSAGYSGKQKIEDTALKTFNEGDYTGDNKVSVINLDTNQAESINIYQNTFVLLYYTPIMNIINSGIISGVMDLEFVYNSDPDPDSYTTDENSQLVTNGTHYLIKNCTYEYNNSQLEIVSPNGTFPFYVFVTVTYDLSELRIERLINKNKTVYDPVVDRYVDIYTAKKKVTSGVFKNTLLKNDIVYHYVATEFEEPAIINNLIVNSNSFLNTNGWVSGGTDKATFNTKLYPQYYGNPDGYDPKAYLIIPQVQKSSIVRNRGLFQFLSFLPDGIQKNEQFVFRIRAYPRKTDGAAPDKENLATGFNINIIKITNSTYYLSRGSESTVIDSDGNEWREVICTASSSISYNDLKTGEYLFQFSGKAEYELWIEDIQFFPLHYGPKPIYNSDGSIKMKDGEIVTKEVRMEPGDMDFLTLSKQIHYFYNHSQLAEITSADDLVYLYRDVEDNPNYWTLMGLLEPSMTDYQKIGTLRISKSNRFNILQQIAETFKCWCVFSIQHNNSGDIVSKQIKFVEEVGVFTGFGFEYGTDLKNVSRTIQSEQFTTKIIVPNNSNEFALNGFCSIARSEFNFPKTNYILNFDYYINHALIDGNEFIKDLYDDASGIGYYKVLNSLNTTFDSTSEKLVAARASLTQKQADYETASKAVIALEEKINEIRNELVFYAKGNYWGDSYTVAYLKKTKDEISTSSRVNTLQNLDSSKKEKDTIATSAKKNIDSLNVEISGYETKLKGINASLDRLDEKFESKYKNFIREGTWQDESYYDDNNYYLDAQEVAYTSSRPQVSYNINVLRLSALEDFEAKVFRIGDIAYVKDIDFFGYQADGLTPYKEKVVVTEITSYFDEPEKDNITVQNYRTQFEDLFQRITASVQALQYNSGSYARAANAISTNGALTEETIKKSFGDTIIVYSTQNENIKQDATGITVSDLTSPNLKTWLSPTGIKITEDGGLTWYNTISGNGIETGTLTAGTIYTDSISIMDGNYTTFRWNESGITAYEPNPLDAEGNNTSFTGNKFTRFDHYGIYGLDTGEEYKIAIDRNFKSDITYYYENIVGGRKTYAREWQDFPPINEVEYLILSKETYNISTLSNRRDPNETYYDKDHNIIEFEDDYFDPDTLYYTKTGNTYNLVNYITTLQVQYPTGYDGTGYSDYLEPALDENGNYVYDIFFDDMFYGAEYYIRMPFDMSSGASFDQDITYYEFNAEDYVFVVTEDIEPDLEKNYYYFVRIEGGFPEYPVYSKEGLDNYELVYPFDLYDSSKSYYVIGVSGVMLSAFDPNSKPYYEFNESTGEYEPTEDEYPVTLKKYYLPKNFNPATEDEIWEVGSYGLTWNGFFLKSRGKKGETSNGSIIISSKDDIRVKSNVQGNSIDRIIIGRLYENEDDTNPDYGIQINNQNGSPVLITGQDGDLWLKEALYIGDESNRNIKLGYFNNEEGDRKEIFSVTNEGIEQFIVYDNGDVFANNGVFNGVIHATDGEFDGKIIADEGSIGGFIIGATQLTSSDSSSIILDSTGKIKTGNIEINGNNSTIEGKNFYISPNINKFNNVEISGKLSTTVFEANHVQAVGGAMIFKPAFNIASTPTQTTVDNVIKWNIELDTDPKKDLNAAGNLSYVNENDYILISFSTVVEGNTSTYEELVFGNIVGRVDAISGSILTVYVGTDNDRNMENAASVVILGKDGSRAVGINSNTSGIQNLLTGEGLSISTFYVEEEEHRIDEFDTNPTTSLEFKGTEAIEETGYKTNLFLGNLENLINTDFSNMKGFGLYADTVYLRGALTTVANEKTFAGVNTNSEVIPPNAKGGGKRWPSFGEDTDEDHPGKIIFWGGADGAEPEDIKDAKFFVTDKGNFYVNSGYFEGTILTRSTIEAAEIKAAKIYGTGKDEPNTEKFGLILYDSSNGMAFQHMNGSESVTDFVINNRGFYTDETMKNKPFISLSSSETTSYNPDVNFYGDNLGIRTARFYGNDANLKLQIDDYIAFLRTSEESESIKSSIKLEDDRFKLSYMTTGLLIDENSIELSKQEEENDITNIYFGNSEGVGKGALKFVHVEVDSNDTSGSGFDIYVQ